MVEQVVDPIYGMFDRNSVIGAAIAHHGFEAAVREHAAELDVPATMEFFYHSIKEREKPHDRARFYKNKQRRLRQKNETRQRKGGEGRCIRKEGWEDGKAGAYLLHPE
jgi:hypothetical protein